MTPAAAAGPGGEPSVEARSAELRLARLHLRGGSYALARSELETLAGADRLDPDAVLDLAEVRWRTGDLAGAAADGQDGAGQYPGQGLFKNYLYRRF